MLNAIPDCAPPPAPVLPVMNTLTPGIDDWTKLLEPGFTASELKSLLAKNVLYRPRDVIYYFERAIHDADKSGSRFITRKNFENAMREYSEYALLALSAEWQPFIPDMMGLLLNFAEKKSILDRVEIHNVLKDSSVSEENLDKAVKFLVECNFLGLAVTGQNFRYALSPTDTTFMQTQAIKYLHSSGGQKVFQIHRAFRDSLSVV